MRYNYLPTNFLVYTHCRFRVMFWTKFKVLYKQKAITQILGKAGLRFFCTVFLLNDIYLPTKFMVNTPCRFGVMSWTKFKV